MQSIGREWSQWVQSQSVDCDMVFEELEGSVTPEVLIDSALRFKSKAIAPYVRKVGT